VLYPNGRVNRYPQWVAAVGDILLALDLLRPTGLPMTRSPPWVGCWRVSCRMGAFAAALVLGAPASLPEMKSDPRDDQMIACVGWVDKVKSKRILKR
jgi:hypothetical protein